MNEEGSGERTDREELLASIRRLTIAVLDYLEQGSKDKSLDQGEKRLLSSTGTRLLRLWKSTLNDDSTDKTNGWARRRTSIVEDPAKEVP